MRQYFAVNTERGYRVFHASQGELIPASAFPVTRAEAEAFTASGRIYHISKLRLWSAGWKKVD